MVNHETEILEGHPPKRAVSNPPSSSSSSCSLSSLGRVSCVRRVRGTDVSSWRSSVLALFGSTEVDVFPETDTKGGMVAAGGAAFGVVLAGSVARAATKGATDGARVVDPAEKTQPERTQTRAGRPAAEVAGASVCGGATSWPNSPLAGSDDRSPRLVAPTAARVPIANVASTAADRPRTPALRFARTTQCSRRPWFVHRRKLSERGSVARSGHGLGTAGGLRFGLGSS